MRESPARSGSPERHKGGTAFLLHSAFSSAHSAQHDELQWKRRRSFVLFPVCAHDIEREDVEAERDDEKREAKCESNQRLRAVELKVTCELAHDLYGDGGDRFTRIERDVGSNARC